jgi:hypothetical protein
MRSKALVGLWSLLCLIPSFGCGLQSGKAPLEASTTAAVGPPRPAPAKPGAAKKRPPSPTKPSPAY